MINQAVTDKNIIRSGNGNEKDILSILMMLSKLLKK